MKKFIVSALVLMTGLSLRAEVSLPSFLSDHMVLQQQSEVVLHGKAEPHKLLRIKTSWDDKEYKVMVDGEGQWKATIQTAAAGGPYTVSFNDGTLLQLEDILLGEVWFCSGQSNMEQPMKGYTSQSIEGTQRELFLSKDNSLRLLTVGHSAKNEPQTDIRSGQWQAADPAVVANFSATAYWFGHFLRQSLQVPVGLVSSNWGGTPAQAWTPAEYLDDFPLYQVPAKDAKWNNQTPSGLYNGMVAPFLGMAMRGVIWYQGESNYEHPECYADLMTAMVRAWREVWNIGEFPFYYCQIAPYDYSIITGKGQPVINSAYLREAQMKAENMIPNCAMVVMLDAGLKGGIHPRIKKVAGERLAMKALAKTYGYEADVESPRFASMEVTDSMALLRFDRSAMRLDCTLPCGQYPEGFSMAGPDSVFHPAKAFIRWNKNEVEVTCPEVSHPVAVRYGFTNWTEGMLKGVNGWPVSSFRTDDWPITPEYIKE